MPKINTAPLFVSNASTTAAVESPDPVGRIRTAKIRFEEPATESAEAEIDTSFFVSGVVPPISEFGPEKMYLTINSAELCAALLFDDRR